MMDNQYIASARSAYQARDYQTALALFSQCVSDPTILRDPGDMGYLFHQIGNCCLQLQQFSDAVNAYTQAAADVAYDASGAVHCNLGKAYASLHDYEHAVEHFGIAVSDASYESSYKAYLGLGNALLKLGKNAEAGVAFRQAALDQRNPDPSKALLNLGVCFMALKRPADAAQSYESALQFDMDRDTRNKMYANLGQAYVACNQMQKAMNAFESALADKTYFLSDSASVDYSVAAKAVATGTAGMPPVAQAAIAAAQNSQTAQPSQQAQPVSSQSDMSGLDVPATGTPTGQDSFYSDYVNDPQYYPADAYGYDVQDGYASADDRFFNASDEELERYSKNIAKKDRKRRNVGLKILVFIFALLLLVSVGGVLLYTQGYGYPMQETVVQELFADTSNADQYFSENVSSDSIDSQMLAVVQDSDITVDSVERGMSTSTLYVTATAAEGGEVSYRVDMVRDLFGWKVSTIELVFASQEQ